MTTAYVETWLLALAITQIAEVPVYLALTRVRVERALSLSFVTHPVVWFVIAPLCTSTGMTNLQMFVLAELFAWITEAALLRNYGVRWRLALLASLVANATSVTVGELSRYYFGVP
jgi:hypothetical protein